MDFSITPTVTKCARAAVLCQPLSEEHRSLISLYCQPEAKTIPLSVVSLISSTLLKQQQHQSQPQTALYIHEILQGSQVVVLPPPRRERSAESLKRLEQAKTELEKKRYQEMTWNVQSMHTRKMQERSELKSASESLSIGLNVIVAMATLFVGGYFIAKASWSGTTTALAFGILASIVALLVESILFILGRSQIEAKEAPENRESRSSSRRRRRKRS